MEQVELDMVWETMKDLDCKMHLVLMSMLENQIGKIDHLWASIIKLGSAIKAVHSRLRSMEEDIGDTLDLLNNHNVGDLSEGVVRALVHLSPILSSILELEEITAKIIDLAEMITAVDKDHQKAGQYLLSKLTSHPPVAPVMAAMGPGGAGQLNLLMLIVNDAVDQVRTLGQLLKWLEMATEENSRLKMQVESLLAEIFSQGVLCLTALVSRPKPSSGTLFCKSAPRGMRLRSFLDVVLLFCCDPVYKPAPGWEQQTCAMDDGYLTTVRKVVLSYYKPHCAWYMGSKKVILGNSLGRSRLWMAGKG